MNVHPMRHKWLLFSILLLASCTSRQKAVETPPPPPKRLEVSYDRLRAYDIDQLKTLVQRRLSAGNRVLDQDHTNIREAMLYFKDAGRIVLSRPDFDHVRTTVFLDVRKRLADFDAVDEVLLQLVDEGIWGLRVGDTSRIEKITYVYLLTNMIAETKSEISKRGAFKQMIEKIRDAELILSDDVALAAEAKTMVRLESPSLIAKRIIDESVKK